MSGITDRVHGTGPRPGLLSRPVDAAAPLPPVRSDPALTAPHHDWARVHDESSGGAGDGGVDGGGAGGGASSTGGRRGWRDRIGRFVGRVAVESQRPVHLAQQDDRLLIGDLIRAADALAARCDALAGRVEALERSVAEVVDVLGADLVQLRADMAALAEWAQQTDPAARSGHDQGPPPRDG